MAAQKHLLIILLWTAVAYVKHVIIEVPDSTPNVGRAKLAKDEKRTKAENTEDTVDQIWATKKISKYTGPDTYAGPEVELPDENTRDILKKYWARKDKHRGPDTYTGPEVELPDDKKKHKSKQSWERKNRDAGEGRKVETSDENVNVGRAKLKADGGKNGREKFKNQLKRFLKRQEKKKNAGLDTITEPNVRLPYSNTGPLVGLPETHIEPKVKVQNPDTYAGPEVEIPETYIEPKVKVQNPDTYAGPEVEIPETYIEPKVKVQNPDTYAGPEVEIPETHIEPKVKVQVPDTYKGPEVEIPETHIEPKVKVQNPDTYAGPEVEIPETHIEPKIKVQIPEYDENNQKHISLYSKIK